MAYCIRRGVLIDCVYLTLGDAIDMKVRKTVLAFLLSQQLTATLSYQLRTAAPFAI